MALRTRDQEQAAYHGMRPADIAADLGCTVEHVHDLIRQGELRAVNIGTARRPYYRVPRAAYEDFLRRRTVRPEASA